MENSTFFDLPLSSGIKNNLKNIGFINPTPIQNESIPLLLEGSDLLGQAQTGTGKTAAFSIPLIETISTSKSITQALVVCPTRELCIQVSKEIERLSHQKDASIIALYGGQPIDRQLRQLKKSPPHIIVATPGRLFDHLNRKSINLSTVKMVVLDEADEMLDMGFKPEIDQIFSLLPQDNQRIFFSATMPKAINDLALAYLRQPKVVKIKAKALTSSQIAQSYYRVRSKEKFALLCQLLHLKAPQLAVVFCNAKSVVDEISETLKARGFLADVLHGDLNQAQRDRVMARFRAGEIKVLIATDIAARGIDVEHVELVINFHLPHDPEDYVHRIGRTGRAGKKGFAISLVEPRDNSRMRRISQFAKIDIAEEHPPSIEKVREAKLASLMNELGKAIENAKLDDYRKFVSESSLPPEDIAAGMMKMAFSNFDKHAIAIAKCDEPIKEFDRKRRSPRRRDRNFNKGAGFRREGGPRREREATSRRDDNSRKEFSSRKDSGQRKEFSQKRDPSYSRKDNSPRKESSSSKKRFGGRKRA